MLGGGGAAVAQGSSGLNPAHMCMPHPSVYHTHQSNPAKVCELTPTSTDIDDLKVFPFFTQ